MSVKTFLVLLCILSIAIIGLDVSNDSRLNYNPYSSLSIPNTSEKFQNLNNPPENSEINSLVSGWNRSEVEELILKEINSRRNLTGSKRLELNHDAGKLARNHSRYMSSENTVSMTRKNGGTLLNSLDEFGVYCNREAASLMKTYWQEEVKGQGYIGSKEKLAEATVSSWLEGETNKELLFDEYDSIGIGAVKDLDEVYITAIICRK
ncbi:MAG: CAP domain-containing protein [Candidatus Nanohalobium sp.]